MTYPSMQVPTAEGVVSRTSLTRGLTVTVCGTPTNWSMNHLVGDRPFSNESAVVCFKMHQEILRSILPDRRQSIFVPRMHKHDTTFRVFCPTRVFGDAYALHNTGLTIHKSRMSLDAWTVPVDKTFLIPTGDCPTAIFWEQKTGEVVVAHCSRQSLMYWDKREGLYDNVLPPVSIIDKVMGYFSKMSIDPTDVHVWTCCGIEPEQFPHPVDHEVEAYANNNREMLDHIATQRWEACIVGTWERGCLDLHELISLQCQSHGIPQEHIQSDKDKLKTFSDWRLWSHAEYIRHGERDVDGRNAIIIERWNPEL